MLFGIFSETARGSIDGYGFHGVVSGSKTDEDFVNELAQVLSVLYRDEKISFFYDWADGLILEEEALDRGLYGDDFDPTLTSYSALAATPVSVDSVLAFIRASDLDGIADEPSSQAIADAIARVGADRAAALEAARRRVVFDSRQTVYHGRTRFSFHGVTKRKANGSETSDDWVLVSDVDEPGFRRHVSLYPFPQYQSLAPAGFVKLKDRIKYWGHLDSDPSVEFFGKTAEEVYLKAAIDAALQAQVSK